MKFYLVKISSNNGNIQSCDEITETKYDSCDQNPSIEFGQVHFPVRAKNPKDAQKEASKTFTGMKDRLRHIN